MFYKSLDHQGINAKAADKKLFQHRALVNEITTKAVEQQNKRDKYLQTSPLYQLSYDFRDSGVILDALRLLAVFLEQTSLFGNADRQKMMSFIKVFVPVFFGIPVEDAEQAVNGIDRRLSEDEMEDVTYATDEPPATRSRRNGNKKDGDLLRGVLDRNKNGKSGRGDKGGNAAAGSKESTPDVPALGEDETMNGSVTDGTKTPIVDDDVIHRWSNRAPLPRRGQTNLPPDDYKLDDPYARTYYDFFCNATLYVFFRLFQILYVRLSHFKESEAEVALDIRQRAKMNPAKELHMVEKTPENFFADVGPNANYYKQVLSMCEDFINGKIDGSYLEEILRFTYIQNCSELYTLDKLLQAISKTVQTVVASDGKDKTNDIASLFMKDREKPRTTHSEQMDYRNRVEKFLVKDDPIYRIRWVRKDFHTTLLMDYIEPRS